MIDRWNTIVTSWKRNLYGIWAAELLALAGFSTSMPIIPFYLQSIGVRDPNQLKLWVGLIQSSASIALGLIAPVWGRVADTYGRRPMLLRAMFGGAIVIALMGFVNRPWQLLVLRTCQGLLTGTVAAATVLVAASVPEEELGYGMGLLQMAVFVGSSVGPMVGGLTTDLVGIRFTFFVTAFMLAAAGLIVLRVVREEFVPQPRTAPFWSNLMPDFSSVLHSRLLVTFILIGFADQVANSIVNPILPLYIQKIATDQTRIASITGLILGLGAVSAAISSAGIGKLSYRMGYRRALLICLTGAFVFNVSQAFVRSTTQLLVLRIVGGFFLGGTIPSVNALIARNTDESKRGSVYGINTSVASTGAAIGPAIGAAVAVAWGYAAAFFATAAVVLSSLSGILIVSRRAAHSPLAPAGGEGAEAKSATRPYED